MFFLIEKGEDDSISIDNQLILRELKRERYLHSFELITVTDFFTSTNALKKETQFPESYKEAIPVGTIQFVTAWFSIFTDITQENPIEIPKILRRPEFLKRKYSIRSANEIPEAGTFFIKDASQLKVFSYDGDLTHLFYEGIWDTPKSELDNALHLDKTHLFQVSEVIPIKSEYRVYILGGEIHSISHYNGDPTIFPDVELIRKANNLYATQPDYPKSYTMDVFVNEQGTGLLELHTLFSTGLYSTIWGSSLLYGLRDAKDYVMNHNTKVSKFSNF